MSSRSGIRSLRHFLAGAVERCDFCRARLPERHAHLIQSGSLRLACACHRCRVDMVGPGSAYRAVTPRQEALEDFQLADADWASLQIPIDVAFLFRGDKGEEPTALFPGPSGATRSQLSGQIWAQLERDYPLLRELEPVTEALLVNRSRGRRDHYRVSADHCYALTGLMRKHWRGLNGGDEAWAAVDVYFADLDRAAVSQETVHA